jgi:hypothetical protein
MKVRELLDKLVLMSGNEEVVVSCRDDTLTTKRVLGVGTEIVNGRIRLLLVHDAD